MRFPIVLYKLVSAVSVQIAKSDLIPASLSVQLLSVIRDEDACVGDLADQDGDIDGRDLAVMAQGTEHPTLAEFAAEFGREDCLFQ